MLLLFLYQKLSDGCRSERRVSGRKSGRDLDRQTAGGKLCLCVCLLQGAARIFLLTKKSVVLADQKTGQVKASVPLPDLASVSVSTQTDGFFALKLKAVRLTKLPILM